MRNILTLTLLSLFLSCGAVFAQANDPALAKAEALIKEGQPAAAFKLLEPLEAKYAGDPTFDYLLASAAQQAGNPSRATFIYERILAINPDFIGVRADMGRAYFQMGDLARAKLEFETVLILPNLPPDLRSAVESYMAALAQAEGGKKRIVVGYMEMGFGRDTNVLGQTSNTIVSLAGGTRQQLTANDLKRPDNYMSYAMGAELIESLDDGLSLYLGGDLRGREHRHIDAADNYTLDTRLGLQYSSGPHVLRGGVIAGRYLLNNTSTRDSTGLTLDWRYLVNPSNQFSINSSATAFRYLPTASKSEDYDNYMLTAGWTHIFAVATAGILHLTVGRENATGGRSDGDKNFWGLRATLQHSFNEKIGAFFTAGHQWGDYSKYNTNYGINREDELSDAALGLVWSLPDRWSVRPLASYTRNKSNGDIYTYSRRDLSVVLRKDF